MWAGCECETERLAIELEGGEGTCGGRIASCCCDGGERCVTWGDDDVELL